MKKEVLERILHELNSKAIITECPMCKQHSIGMVEGLFVNNVHKNNLNPFSFQETNIPTACAICNNCGYVMQFAIKALINDWDKIKDDAMKG